MANALGIRNNALLIRDGALCIGCCGDITVGPCFAVQVNECGEDFNFTRLDLLPWWDIEITSTGSGRFFDQSVNPVFPSDQTTTFQTTRPGENRFRVVGVMRAYRNNGTNLSDPPQPTRAEIEAAYPDIASAPGGIGSAINDNPISINQASDGPWVVQVFGLSAQTLDDPGEFSVDITAFDGTTQQETRTGVPGLGRVSASPNSFVASYTTRQTSPTTSRIGATRIVAGLELSVPNWPDSLRPDYALCESATVDTSGDGFTHVRQSSNSYNVSISGNTVTMTESAQYTRNFSRPSTGEEENDELSGTHSLVVSIREREPVTISGYPADAPSFQEAFPFCSAANASQAPPTDPNVLRNAQGSNFNCQGCGG